jgi:hypothetical protein
MSVIHIKIKNPTCFGHSIRPSSGVHSACAFTTTNVRAVSHTRMWLCVTVIMLLILICITDILRCSFLKCEL